MLQLLTGLHRDNTEKKIYHAFHPKGADDEHPSKPMYAFPYRDRYHLSKISEYDWEAEYDAYLAAGIAHKRAGMNVVRIGGMSGDKVIVPKKKLEDLLVGRPLTYTEYLAFVKSHESDLWQNENISLAEILAHQFPDLRVAGADMVRKGKDQEELQKLGEENAGVGKVVSPVIDAYMNEIVHAKERPQLQPLQDAAGKLTAVKIGGKTFMHPDTLLLDLQYWVEINEKTLGFATAHAKGLAQRLDGILIAGPDLLRELETEAPAGGRSVFMPNGPVFDHQLLQPVPFDTVVKHVQDLVRALKKIVDGEKNPAPNDQKEPLPGLNKKSVLF